eukprot:12336855-Ditylum_brightwellii.AAC.1
MFNDNGFIPTGWWWFVTRTEEPLILLAMQLPLFWFGHIMKKRGHAYLKRSRDSEGQCDP